MGGKAFDSHGPNGGSLNVPRLQPHQYTELRDWFTHILEVYYHRALCTREAPGKLDYGDVDILVDAPRATFSISELANSLGATFTVDHGISYSFAVPFSASTHLHDSFVDQMTAPVTPSYAQLDVLHCPDNLDWMAFMQSYGDLWQILGVALRGYGLTANDKGLHVRVAGMEARNWKGSMVFLSKEPDRIMDFLGLNSSEFERGFETEEQLLTWLSQCRLFSKSVFSNRSDTADDRRRVQTRGMFRRYVENWAPKLSDPDEQSQTLDRAKVTKEAIVFFDRVHEYERKATQAEIMKLEEQFWLQFSSTMANLGVTNDKLNLTMRGFKRWVNIEDGALVMRSSAEMDEENQPHFAVTLSKVDGKIKVDVLMWIVENWEFVKNRENQRVKDAKQSRAAARAVSPAAVVTWI